MVDYNVSLYSKNFDIESKEYAKALHEVNIVAVKDLSNNRLVFA